MNALSTKELTNLLNLLSDENMQSCNLESLVATYHRYFTRQDSYRVGSALVLLLRQRDLLPSPPQRLAALFLLHELYRSDSTSANPFTLFFVQLLQSNRDNNGGASSTEQWFLSQILSPSLPRELYKKTPAALTSLDASQRLVPDVGVLVAALLEQQSDIGAHNCMGLSCVIPDGDTAHPSISPDPALSGQVAETLLCGPEQLTEQPFEPSFIRPLPPLHPCSNEIMWLTPSESQYSIKWDPLMCTSSGSEVRKLFSKACREALTSGEQQSLSAHLEAQPKLVYHIGLSPQKLPLLVEKNPTVAIDALLRLINSVQISEYLAALLNMEMCLHSMEVVNRLTTVVELPMEFLHLYINNCIQRCRDTADKNMQNRYVRLVCVFLQSLIRNKVISTQTLKDEYVEIHGFCLDYSRIKEAAALYRLVKTLEVDGAPTYP